MTLETGSDLWVVGSHFNPSGYRSRRENCLRFVAGLEQAGVPYRIAECAFGEAPFELPRDLATLRVRGLDVMWQKERLLNLAIASLPGSCTKVAWLDCDLLFANAEWARETSAALDSTPVVQPFTEVVLRRRASSATAEGDDVVRGIAAVQAESSATLRSGDFRAHGHTGFAWAARRDWIDRHGLYDACILGGADELMAHAFYGDTGSRCVDRLLGASGPQRAHFERWAEAVYPDVLGRVASVAGRVTHLWHGEWADRGYLKRAALLGSFGFDPERDIAPSEEGPWRWASVEPRLHRLVRDYFAERNEDGTTPATRPKSARVS